MPDPLCKITRQSSERSWRECDVECFPGPWRRWCDGCVKRLPESVDPEDVTDMVLRRTVTSSTGTGNVLHVPADAVAEVA